ncbi:MAG: ABC transporter ATP-binding protein [Bacteroidota bacterium]
MIEVKNLSKKYKNQEALKGISFTINEGEFYGLLGPNGAGKSTTISILSTITHADGGTATIGGFDVKKDTTAVKRIIGIVPQEIALYEELTAFENLQFFGSLYQVPRSELTTRIDELLNLFGLFDRKNDRIATYSGGMKRRINIAAALLHRPKIVFLDEPTVGIDPQSRNLIFEVLAKLHKEGLTIVYTTHYMEEAERFCDRIGIIDEGKIIAEGTLQELKSAGKMKESIQVQFTNGDEAQLAALNSFWNDSKQNENSTLFYSENVQADLPKLISKCNALGLDISQIDIQKINLESIFMDLTGKQLRD